MSSLFDIDFIAGEPEEMNGALIYREIFEIVLDRFTRTKPMTFQNLFLYAGNDKEYIVYVKDRDLVPIDLTGASAVMTFRESKSNPDVSLEVDGVISIPTEGEVRFTLVPEDTATLSIRQYVFDVKITTATSKVFTVIDGVLTLKQGVS